MGRSVKLKPAMQFVTNAARILDLLGHGETRKRKDDMQPTMKLRWRKAKHGEECAAFWPQYRHTFCDDFDHIEGMILQQLWVGENPYGEIAHEWRDIEIQEE